MARSDFGTRIFSGHFGFITTHLGWSPALPCLTLYLRMYPIQPAAFRYASSHEHFLHWLPLQQLGGLLQPRLALHQGHLTSTQAGVPCSCPMPWPPTHCLSQSPWTCSLPHSKETPLLDRKHKRIHTAFSPSQLLKLLHAFEKNHYFQLGSGPPSKHLGHGNFYQLTLHGP